MRIHYVGLVILALNTCFAQVAVHPRVRVSEAVANGLVIRNVDPTYPKAAISQKIQGEVVLELEISEAGRVQSVHVISGQKLLAKAAVTAAKRWKFQPYLLQGNPIAMLTTQRVKFVLPSQ